MPRYNNNCRSGSSCVVFPGLCRQRARHKALESEYSFKHVLQDDPDGTYTLHWKFDLDAKTITFAVNVSTNGWVGFGLSPNGGMPNSDVVIGWVKDEHVYFNVSAEYIIYFACGDQW